MTALSMGLGQEQPNGRKEGAIKQQMDDTALIRKTLSHGKPGTLGQRQ